MLDTAPPNADTLRMAGRRLPKLSDQFRAAIREADDAGVTRYAISKATGIDQAVLSKFLSGERGMSLESLDKLAAFLKLEVRKACNSKGST